MRRLIIILIFSGAFSFVKAQPALVLQADGDSAHAVLKFTTTQWWLWNVPEGEIAEHKFWFVNAGNAPLLISEVMQTQFTPNDQLKEPVMPGDSGFVIIQMRTEGKRGNFTKTATVKSNNRNGDIVLSLNGNIIPRPAPDAPIIKFDSTTYWFDTVYQSTIVDAEFRFTNTGKSPLIISIVTGSSGSICPSYPKEPIAPGKTGVITVVFHTGGKMGPQDKTVTVTSNASEPTIVLHLKGIVVLPPPLKESTAPAKKSGQ